MPKLTGFQRSSISIEKPSLRDFNAIVQLDKICFGEDAWTCLDVLLTLSKTNGMQFRAVDDGRLIGYAAAEYHADEGVTWIITIAVSPEFRGMGIGKRLLCACEETSPVPLIRLCVASGNINAISLYQKNNYRIVGLWPAYYESGKDAFVMEKK